MYGPITQCTTVKITDDTAPRQMRALGATYTQGIMALPQHTTVKLVYLTIDFFYDHYEGLV